MFEGLLPIGTVVLLKNSKKRLMIIGVVQQQLGEENKTKVWDYVGCYYPEGYMGPELSFLFNQDQIEHIYAIGFQDEEQFEFKTKADQLWKSVKQEAQTDR